MIDVKVFDVAGSNGLYSVVGKRGLYFKNFKGYDGTSGALGQVLIHLGYTVYNIHPCIRKLKNLVESPNNKELRNFGRYDRPSRFI